MEVLDASMSNQRGTRFLGSQQHKIRDREVHLAEVYICQINNMSSQAAMVH